MNGDKFSGIQSHELVDELHKRYTDASKKLKATGFRPKDPVQEKHMIELLEFCSDGSVIASYIDVFTVISCQTLRVLPMLIESMKKFGIEADHIKFQQNKYKELEELYRNCHASMIEKLDK